jgi:hypothetical protein
MTNGTAQLSKHRFDFSKSPAPGRELDRLSSTVGDYRSGLKPVSMRDLARNT